LRCVFHGWKFDVEGRCVEQLNEPVSFAHKVQAVAYPTLEMGGVIWAYLGPANMMPPPPKFEWTQAPESHRYASKVVEECNWLQALEGGLDTSHVPILHRSLVSSDPYAGVAVGTPLAVGEAPRVEVDETDYGYRYAGIRPLADSRQYVRTYHFVMPWTQIRPQQIFRARTGERLTLIAGHMWVPIDAASCMVWNWIYSFGEAPVPEDERLEIGTGNGRDAVDFDNGFRSFRNPRNNWLIDRDVQKRENYTGIPGINAQDRAVQESMGPIVNRSREHLGPADRAIIVARQLLAGAVRSVQEGKDPPGVGPSYYQARAIERIFPAEQSWREALMPEMYPEELRV